MKVPLRPLSYSLPFHHTIRFYLLTLYYYFITMPPIPLDRSKGLVTFGQLHTLAKEFKVDRKVCRLFSDNGRDIIKVVKPIITKYATDSSGNFSTNWKLMSSTQRASLVRYVHEKEPRLEGVFEGEWATDWVLKKLIDQRVADAKRVSAHKRKIQYSVCMEHEDVPGRGNPLQGKNPQRPQAECPARLAQRSSRGPDSTGRPLEYGCYDRSLPQLLTALH
jgi:hypothetical protein